MITVLLILMSWQPNAHGWYLCHAGPYYNQYVESRNDCWYGYEQNAIHLTNYNSAVILMSFDPACISGPDLDAEDDCCGHDFDGDGSVTLRDVSRWME